MLAFETDEPVAGTKTVRMEQRTTQRAKALIEEAACLLGVNASEFMVVAAAKAARETVREYSTTILKKEQHEAFLRAFDTDKPTDEMVALMKMHSEVAAQR